MMDDVLRALGAPPAAIEGHLMVKEWLDSSGIYDTKLRTAHFLGQCAHESAGFTKLRESLYYSTPERLMAVWPSRFPEREVAEMYVRNSEALANVVYAGRMGNGAASTGDGFRFRGRGYIQITGRANYERYGGLIGIDLLADPDRAQESGTAWQIAAAYFLNAKRGGKTVAEWADLDNLEQVTRTINGGTHGLVERSVWTDKAKAALERAIAAEQVARAG
jgi:putative chitinase